MLKKIKENLKWNKLKELWASEKSHSVMVLGFWLLFMFILIVFARLSSSTSSTVGNTTLSASNFSNFKSYDFSYLVNDNIYNGSYYDGKTLFYMSNNRYYENGYVYLISGDTFVRQDNFNMGVMKIDSKFLNNLLSGINFSDENGYKRYVVSLDRFVNLYDVDTDMNLSDLGLYNVSVDVYENNDTINKVVLDLSNYYGIKNGYSTSYVVTIYYYNINNLNDFSKSYDKLIGVK